MKNKATKQLIHLSAICKIDECIAASIADTCHKLEVSVESMRQVTSNETTISIFNLSGSWHSINKLETYLNKIGSDNSNVNISYIVSDQQEDLSDEYIINYHLNIVAPTDDNLLYELQNFFRVNEIGVEHFSFDNYQNCINQVPLIVINAKINILKDISLSDLRERFILFCDSLNIDGVLDPIRPI